MKKQLFFFIVMVFSFAVAFGQADTTLNQYKGIYKLKEGSAAPSVEISIQDGELFASATISSAALSKVAKDTFSTPERNGMVYFSRNSEGKVAFIRIEVGDLVLEGVKEGGAIALIERKKRYYPLSR